MKKTSTTLIIAILTCLLFSSCDKDEQKEKPWPPTNYITVGSTTQEIQRVGISDNWWILATDNVNDNFEKEPSEYIALRVNEVKEGSSTLYRTVLYVKHSTIFYWISAKYRHLNNTDKDIVLFDLSGQIDVPMKDGRIMTTNIKAYYDRKYTHIENQPSWIDALN